MKEFILMSFYFTAWENFLPLNILETNIFWTVIYYICFIYFHGDHFPVQNRLSFSLALVLTDFLFSHGLIVALSWFNPALAMVYSCRYLLLSFILIHLLTNLDI